MEIAQHPDHITIFPTSVNQAFADSIFRRFPTDIAHGSLIEQPRLRGIRRKIAREVTPRRERDLVSRHKIHVNRQHFQRRGQGSHGVAELDTFAVQFVEQTPGGQTRGTTDVQDVRICQQLVAESLPFGDERVVLNQRHDALFVEAERFVL